MPVLQNKLACHALATTCAGQHIGAQCIYWHELRGISAKQPHSEWWAVFGAAALITTHWRLSHQLSRCALQLSAGWIHSSKQAAVGHG